MVHGNVREVLRIVLNFKRKNQGNRHAAEYDEECPYQRLA